jgi:hypothetical protein
VKPVESNECAGQALIETAVSIPLLVLLMLNAINFGFYMYGWVTVNNAARAIAEYRVYNGVAVGFPPVPTLAQVQCVLYDEVSTLPKKGSGSNCVWANVTLRICSNKNGTVSCTGSGSYTPPADVEPARYALYSAEISYTFTPVFPYLVIPVIKAPLTIFPATIYRHVLMRSMQ